MLIPTLQHYDFHFFVMNKSTGPGGRRLFDYSSDAPRVVDATKAQPDASESVPLSTAESRAAAAKPLADINTLEGASEDPTLTKVVDRRWYEKNKHIYPASTWQEFDPEKDYATEIRKDTGGNTYFFSK
jgi:protein FAM50